MIYFLYSAVPKMRPEVLEIGTFVFGFRDTPASRMAWRIFEDGLSDEQYELYWGFPKPSGDVPLHEPEEGDNNYFNQMILDLENKNDLLNSIQNKITNEEAKALVVAVQNSSNEYFEALEKKSLKEIKIWYRKLCLIFHPDKPMFWSEEEKEVGVILFRYISTVYQRTGASASVSP